jgi:dihydropteroate synthase
VAEAGIKAGADMINDIWGLKHNEGMADVVAKGGVACCLVHNRPDMNYGNFMRDVVTDLAGSIELAKKAGIEDDKIILDPGVGFAKSYKNNLELLNRLEELCVLGYPYLLGASRKSVVGQALDLPVEDRLEGTLATTALGVVKGCSFIRVHDIQENVRIIRMMGTVLKSGRP